MSENDNYIAEQLLSSVPGGIARIAMNDELSILSATDNFYSLIKNAAEKADSKATMGLLRMVYSADIIYVTQQIAGQKNRKDNQINFNFRILQPNGSFKWVMITGNKTDEVYQSGTKLISVYDCLAMDVTGHMIKYKKLEQETDYHRTIAELSKELYFEYEIATDTLDFTELFREVFGKDSEIKEFSRKLEKSKLIHPSELPAVVKIYRSMMSGKKQVRFELRLIPKEGVPVWYVCYASIIFDENRNPYKLIGKLATTNPLRKEVETAAPALSLDSLTTVCTKDSAESMMKEALSKQDTESLSSLMLLEVRNYKGVNEIMRVTNGENPMVTIAGLLKNTFRTTDIIGRTGLNEFIVLQKDIRSDKNAYEAAEQLCKEVDSLFSYEHYRQGLTVSIGMAFANGEKSEYPVLLANAKAALVMAKKETSSSFEVFYGIVNN